MRITFDNHAVAVFGAIRYECAGQDLLFDNHLVKVPDLDATPISRNELAVLFAFHRFEVFPDYAVNGRSCRSSATI